MQKAQVKQIADYIQDLEEGFVEYDYDHIAMRVELPKLYQTIKTLMDATFKTKDQQLEVLLAALDLKARKCKKHIEQRK